MTEANNTPVPPGPEQKKQAPAQPETDLREELARARSRSKLMTGVAVSLGMIFIILAGVIYVVYNKISAAKENFEEAFRAMPAPPSGYQPENRMLAGQGVYQSTSMPASTLGMFSGGLPGGGAPANFNPEEAARVTQSLSKYSERPVMKEFIADLKKNPEIAAALEKTKSGNPMELIALAQNSKGMEKIMAKYATRPDFLKTMMEIANDPALKAAAQKAQGMGGMPQGSPMPVSIQSGPQPETSSEGDGEMTFDPSAISGTSKTAPISTKKVPSPVDNGQ